MGAFQLTVHADLYHYRSKKTLRGVAKLCSCFVPREGMHIGPSQLLTICQVHWLGGNEFAVYTTTVAEYDRSAENARYAKAGLAPMPDVWKDRDEMRAAVDKILWLRFDWREEDDEQRPDGDDPPPDGGGDQRGPGQP